MGPYLENYPHAYMRFLHSPCAMEQSVIAATVPELPLCTSSKVPLTAHTRRGRAPPASENPETTHRQVRAGRTDE